MSKKIWNLMYVVGNPRMFDRVTANADNPCSRAEALEGANTVANNGGNWRTWVEHKDTGERIFESATEIAYRTAAENAKKPEAVSCPACKGAGKLPEVEGDHRALGCGECCGTGKVLHLAKQAEKALA